MAPGSSLLKAAEKGQFRFGNKWLMTVIEEKHIPIAVTGWHS